MASLLTALQKKPWDCDSELASTGSMTSGYGSWDCDPELASTGSMTSGYGSWDRDF